MFLTITVQRESIIKMPNAFLSDWFKDTVKPDAAGGKDWVFLNYTFKRFEGLTQRGVKLPLM